MKKILMSCLLAAFFMAVHAQPYLEQGLVAFYSFNGDANDHSGNNNHGTPYGVWPVADHNGIANFAYYFDGIASKVSVVEDEFVTDRLSVSFWIRITQSATFKFCIACSDFCVFTENDSVGLAISVPTTKMVKAYAPIGVWTQVVGTFDNQHIRIYVNGSITDSVYHPGIIYDANWQLSMGMFGSNYWEGELDDIRIYNRALPAAEIAELWAYYGVEEEEGISDFRTWPMPCNQTINFAWPHGIPEVSLYAVDGHKVCQARVREGGAPGVFSLDMSGMAAGVYCLICESGDKRAVTRILKTN